jgi:rhodanese-related sulfurtransferase
MADHNELTAAELKAMMDADKVLLVDVREPEEFAAGHIKGAINHPLSRFDAHAIAAPAGKRVVLQCAGGKRSGQALDKCASADAAIDTHLAGGIGAWAEAGLPVVKN